MIHQNIIYIYLKKKKIKNALSGILIYSLEQNPP